MTTACSSTANSITEVILGGDALLNLTQQSLNTTQGTVYVTGSGNTLSCSTAPGKVTWRDSMVASLASLLGSEISRIVVVSEENCSDAKSLVSELSRQNIPHLHCTLMPLCEADAFMDEEDTEAVTERLRQLGYL
jgi:hypothetical protein